MWSLAALRQAMAQAAGRHCQPRQSAFVPSDVAHVGRVVAEELSKLGSEMPAEHIREWALLRDHLGLDQLDCISLALALEDRLRLTGTIDFRALRTVRDVVQAAVRLLGPTSLRRAVSGSPTSR